MTRCVAGRAGEGQLRWGAGCPVSGGISFDSTGHPVAVEQTAARTGVSFDAVEIADRIERNAVSIRTR
jgi:hypothetical protein